MKNLYQTYFSTRSRYVRSILIFLVYLSCLLIGGINWASAQISFDSRLISYENEDEFLFILNTGGVVTVDWTFTDKSGNTVSNSSDIDEPDFEQEVDLSELEDGPILLTTDFFADEYQLTKYTPELTGFFQPVEKIFPATDRKEITVPDPTSLTTFNFLLKFSDPIFQSTALVTTDLTIQNGGTGFLDEALRSRETPSTGAAFSVTITEDVIDLVFTEDGNVLAIIDDAGDKDIVEYSFNDAAIIGTFGVLNEVQRITTFTTGDINSADQIAVDDAGNIYVYIDGGSGVIKRINKLSSSGALQFSRTFSFSGKQDQFSGGNLTVSNPDYDSDFEVAPDGSFFILGLDNSGGLSGPFLVKIDNEPTFLNPVQVLDRDDFDAGELVNDIESVMIGPDNRIITENTKNINGYYWRDPDDLNTIIASAPRSTTGAGGTVRYGVGMDENGFIYADNSVFDPVLENSGGYQGFPFQSGRIIRIHDAYDGKIVTSYEEGTIRRIQIWRQPNQYYQARFSLTSSNVDFFSVSVPVNTVEGLLGNTNAAVTFSRTIDFDPPSVVSSSPANGGFTSNLDQNIFISFDKDIEIYEGSNNNLFILKDGIVDETFDFSSSEISVSGDLLTINPNNSFEVGSSYAVRIRNIIRSVAQVPFSSSNVSQTIMNFEISAGAPVIVSQDPEDGETNVLIDKTLQITFEEDITFIESDEIELRLVSDDTEVPATVSFLNNILSIDPDDDLQNETDYYVYITADAIEGLAGDPNTFEFLTNADYSFTTIPASDGTPPTVVSRSPADDATDILASTTELELTFDEPIFFRSGRDGSDTDILGFVPANSFNNIGSSNVNIDGNKLTLTVPSPGLSEGGMYYVRINSLLLVDLEGNPFGGYSNTTDWNFTVADNTAPSVVSFSPMDGQTGISQSANIDIQFNEFIFLDDASKVELRNAADDALVNSSITVLTHNNNLRINPTGFLSADTEYYVYIANDAIRDAANNFYEGIDDKTTFNFFTLDTVDPVIISRDPAIGATDVPVNTDITITFDEDIVLIDETTIFLFGPGSSIISKSVSVNGADLIISPDSDLGFDSNYRVTIGNGDIEDQLGNTFNGFSGTTYNFTTAANINVWNGTSWSLGTPSSSSNVIFNADYPFGTDEVLEINNMTIGTGVVFDVDETGTLIINGDYDNSGSFTIASGASLITFEGSVTDGDVIVKRNPSFGSSDRSIGKYSFVSIPIEGTYETQNLGDLVYEFTEGDEDESSNGYDLVPSGTIMGQAKGYAVAFSPEELSFMGQPATGNISISVPTPQNSGFHLVGNPYSAAISVTEFFSDNAFASSIAIWDDGGGQSGGTQTGSFVQINDLGSVTASSNLNGNSYNGYIGSAQGFFVETISGGTISFAEDQRVSGNNDNGSYFRKADFSFLKLSMSNTTVKKETLIALHPEATEGIDIQMDAKLRRSDFPIELYSLLEDEEFAIQAVYPENLVSLPLGFSADGGGVFEIGFHSLDRMDDYEVTLFDRVTKSKIEVIEGFTYSFESNAGTFNDRFALSFSNVNAPLSASKQLESEFHIVPHANGLELKSPIPISDRLLIHTVDGRRIFERYVDVSGATWVEVDLKQNQLYLIRFDKYQLKLLINEK